MASELFETLSAAIKSRKDGNQWTRETGEHDSLVFPAHNPETGKIEIFDDGNELTLVVGKLFHSHFSSDFIPSFTQHSFPLSDDQICEVIFEFVDDFIQGKIVIYSCSVDGQISSAGYQYVGSENQLPENSKFYLWTGPI